MIKPITLFLVIVLATTVGAQLIDIDVRDQFDIVIGEEPECVFPSRYKTNRRWVANSLAVYLDGRRCQVGVDYQPLKRDKEIKFLCPTDDDSVVIIDYIER